MANSQSDTVTLIRTATGTIETPIRVGNFPFGIAITLNGKTAYVANYSSGTVTPIRTAINTAGAPSRRASPCGHRDHTGPAISSVSPLRYACTSTAPSTAHGCTELDLAGGLARPQGRSRSWLTALMVYGRTTTRLGLAS